METKTILTINGVEYVCRDRYQSDTDLVSMIGQHVEAGTPFHVPVLDPRRGEIVNWFNGRAITSWSVVNVDEPPIEATLG